MVRIKVIVVESDDITDGVIDSIHDLLRSTAQPAQVTAAAPLPELTPLPALPALEKLPPIAPPRHDRSPKAESPQKPVPSASFVPPKGRQARKVVCWVEESGKDLTAKEASELAGVHETHIRAKIKAALGSHQRDFVCKDKHFRILPGVGAETE